MQRKIGPLWSFSPHEKNSSIKSVKGKHSEGALILLNIIAMGFNVTMLHLKMDFAN